MRVRAIALLVSLGITAPSAAQPDAPAVAGAAADLAAIRQMVLYARYPAAVDASRRYLGRRDIAAVERTAALELLAIALIADRRETEARRTLAELYGRDPGHRLGELDPSPIVQSFFASAREAAPEPIAVALARITGDEVEASTAVDIEIRIAAGADAVQDVRLSHRVAGEPSFVRMMMTPGAGGRVRARVPLPAPGWSGTLEYHVEALAPSQTPLASLGSESEPLALAVVARSDDVLGAAAGGAERPVGDEEEGGILGSFWFWAAVGAVAIGGGVGGWLLLREDQDARPAGFLGEVMLGP